jgi:hypothetical protein
MNTRARLLAGLLALMMASAGCIGGRSLGDTSALVVGSLIGAVRARPSSAATWQSLSKDERVPIGSTIQVPARGSVLLKRGDVSSVQLVPYDGQPAEMRIDSVGAIEMISGDMLVRADEKAPISVASQGVSAAPMPSDAVTAPIYRFDRRVSIRVGVYTGEASVSALDGTLPIPTLREGVVAARELPPSVTPLTIDPRDPFDRQLLLDVIDLDAELASDSRGYEAAFGARMKKWQEIKKIEPNRDLSFTAPYLKQTGSADILIGVVFALLYEQRSHQRADETFANFLALLDQGATWGLLAREYLGADQLTPFREAVTRAIALRTGEITSPTVGAVPSPTPNSTSTAPPPPPPPTPSPTPSKKPSPTPTPTPSTTSLPTPSPTCTFIIFPVGC